MPPKIAPCLVFIVILYGCATTRPVGGHYTSIGMGAEMELPTGWHIVGEAADAIWITINHDQHIKIGRYSVLRRFSADDPDSKKMGLTPDTRPEQASKAIFNELHAHVSDLKIIETSTVQLAGQEAFKTLYTYIPDSKPMKGEYYGFIKGEWHYHFIYEAPIEEFDMELPVFEKVVQSLRLIPEQATN